MAVAIAIPKQRVRPVELDGFAKLGTVFVEVEAAFRQADYSGVFEEFHHVLEDAHAGYFRNEAGPSGSAWPPLAPATVRRKGHDTILFEHGPLRESLSGPGAGIRETTDRGLTFGTAVDYASWHQEGTSRLPQREHVGMDEGTLDVLLNAVADKTVETLKG